MNRRAIFETLFDHNIRIDKIIWLAANSADISSELEDFLYSDWDEALKLFGEKSPDHERDMPEYLNLISRKGFNGYLVRAAVPVYEGLGGTTVSYSWGNCYVRWFYFETWDEQVICEALTSWEEKQKKAANKPKRRAKGTAA